MSGETVITRTPIEFERWLAPNFAVIAHDPVAGNRDNGTCIKVEKLGAVALADMAAAWLNDLYGKTQIPNPFSLPDQK